jgi:hypothetical protein
MNYNGLIALIESQRWQLLRSGNKRTAVWGEPGQKLARPYLKNKQVWTIIQS